MVSMLQSYLMDIPEVIVEINVQGYHTPSFMVPVPSKSKPDM
jgi:hypothetical protein